MAKSKDKATPDAAASRPDLPLFYRDVVALSREGHKGWYIAADQGYSFAAQSNSVYVAASEFSAAAREYALVFARGADGAVVPAALLGLRPDENMFVTSENGWDASYIPAYVRRYPFILATATPDGDQFTVCIDESFSGFNTAQEGEQLITKDGEHGELLGNSVKFLQEFHKHTVITKAFCEALDEAGLLDSMQAQIALNSGQKMSLSGFLCVTREKLKTLDAEQLKGLFDKGFLDLIYFHMHSLNNMDKLMERLSAVTPEAQNA
jgi:hypothetical protein